VLNSPKCAFFTRLMRERGKLKTRWWRAESGANSSPSICQPVDTLAAVDKPAVDRRPVQVLKPQTAFYRFTRNISRAPNFWRGPRLSDPGGAPDYASNRYRPLLRPRRIDFFRVPGIVTSHHHRPVQAMLSAPNDQLTGRIARPLQAVSQT
jgi:hypothetical protein